MILKAVIAGAFALAIGSGAAQAAPIDVSYTVTGSAGNWTYDFTVKNNLPTPFNAYMLGAFFASDDITGTPSGWIDFNTISTPPFTASGNLNHAYNNVWRVDTPFESSIAPGNTLSGFVAVDHGATALTSLDWFVFAIALQDQHTPDTSVLYSGPGCSVFCGGGAQYNPGFEGTAVAAVAATPLPAALPLFATGLAGLGLLGWRGKRRAA